jgi:hypothetical protein
MFGKHLFDKQVFGWFTDEQAFGVGATRQEKPVAALMVDVVIDSPRWRDGWGEPLSTPRPERPALVVVDGGHRRPAPTVVRRRRLVALVALGLVVALALGIASMVLARPATAGSLPEGRRTHLVEAGDTYWSIAGEYDDGVGDLRIAVDELIDANGARPLFPGDRIDLP